MPIEFNLLRRFDEASRVLNDGSVQLELVKGPTTNVSASYRYLGKSGKTPIKILVVVGARYWYEPYSQE